jgi:hypothetical protein
MKFPWKAFFIGLLGVAAACWVVSYAELVITYIQLGILQFPPVVLGLFLPILLVNRLLRRVARWLSLSSQELIIIYCMMLLGTMVASRGLMEKLLPLLVSPNYFANESNSWAQLFFPHIRRWMVPFDPSGPPRQKVAVRFFEGLRYGEPIPWGDWLGPLLAWLILVAAVFTTFFCLASILRRQWVDHEKLSFPLVQLPLEMAREETSTPFFRNRLTWIGIGLPAAVFLVNGLSSWYPSVPQITLQYQINQLFVSRPWNAMYYTPAFLSFAAVGFLYLLPSELLFALWFFFVLTRVQDVVYAAYGMEVGDMPLYPTRLYIGYQVMGAYMVLVGYFFYSSWPYLKGVWARALKPVPEDDSRELLPYRTAVIGLVLGFTTAVAWAHAAGLSLWAAFGAMFVYMFIVAIIMARSTAECGLLMTETSFRPVDIYRLFAPTHMLGPSNMTAFAFLDPSLFRDQRGLVLTGFLDGLKMADGVGGSKRVFGAAFVVALLAALVLAAVFQLWLPYHRGGITMYSYVYQANNIWAFQDYAPAMAGQSLMDWHRQVFFVVGVLVALFLAIMRTRFAWWPFHPLAYALSASWTLIVFWFPCFVAWLVKTLILRYGGMRLYVRMRPFFLGMILGEFGMAVFWAVVSWIFNAPAPFFPWP